MIKHRVFFTFILLLTLHTTTRPNLLWKAGASFTAYYLYQVQQQNNDLLRKRCEQDGMELPEKITFTSTFVDVTGGALQWTANKAIEMATGKKNETTETNKENEKIDDLKTIGLALLELAKSKKQD